MYYSHMYIDSATIHGPVRLTYPYINSRLHIYLYMCLCRLLSKVIGCAQKIKALYLFPRFFFFLVCNVWSGVEYVYGYVCMCVSVIVCIYDITYARHM